MSEELKNRIRVAIADPKTAEEFIALLEAQASKIEDLESRVVALEEAP